MFDVILEGEFGWEINPQDLRNQLRGKGDVIVSLNSYGGSVFDGMEVYNILKDHPGNVVVQCGSIVASSAGWAMLGADEVWVQENTTWMTHQVTSFGYGTGDDLRKSAEVNDGLETLIIDIFENNGQDRETITNQMKEETWFFGGQAIIDAGLANEIIKVDGIDSEIDEESVNRNKARVMATQNKVEQHFAENKSDFFKKGKNILNILEKKPKFSNNKQKPELKKETPMTLDELKNKHPEVYAQAKNEGVTQERNRSEAWMEFNDIAPEEVKNGIAEGKDLSQKNMAQFSRMAMNKAALNGLEVDAEGKVETPEAPAQVPEENDKPSDEVKELDNALANRYGVK